MTAQAGQGLDLAPRLMNNVVQDILVEHKEMKDSMSSILSRLSQVEAVLAGLGLSAESPDFRDPVAQRDEKSHTTVNHNPGLEKDPEASGADPTSHRTSARSVSLGDVDWEYEFEASIWNSALLLGQKQTYLDTIGHVGITLVFFAIMFSMVYVIADGFAQNPFNDAFLDRLRFWRATMGHNIVNVNTYDSSSLVSRVCSDDPALTLAVNQQTINSDILSYKASSYLSSLQSGPVVCICCLMVYVMIMITDCQSAIYGQLAVWNIRSSLRTTLHHDVGTNLVLARVSNIRCVFFLIVSIARIAFNIVLLFFGCEWLVYTTGISDLLLNTTALTFLLDVDGILFQLAAPHALRVSLQTLEPLAMPRFLGRQFTPFFFFVFTIASVAGFYLAWMKDLMKSMDEAHEIMCGGDKHFVASVSKHLGVHWAKSKKYDPDKPLSSWADGRYYSIKSIIDKDSGMKNHAFKLHSVTAVFGMQQTTVTTYSKRCTDSSKHFHVGGHLYAVTNNATMKDHADCSSFSWLCLTNQEGADLLRILCPMTCNCFMPDSPLGHLRAPAKGCPQPSDCQYSTDYSDAQKYLKGRYCLDASLTVLRSMATWNQTLQVIATADSKWLGGEKQALVASQNFAKFGCKALSRLDRQTVTQVCLAPTVPFLCPATCQKLAPNTCNCNAAYSEGSCQSSIDCPPSCTPKCMFPPEEPHTPYDPAVIPNGTCAPSPPSPNSLGIAGLR